MCCRFFLEMSPELRPYIEAADHSPILGKMTAVLKKTLIKAGEVRPRNIVPVIAPNRASLSPTVFPMLWGFTSPVDQKAIFNARVESAADKQLFRDSWEKRRCVIPASCYYEWNHRQDPDAGKSKSSRGTKKRIWIKDKAVLYMAGLYRMEQIDGTGVPVFTILTREAGREIQPIHNRMPVILPESCISKWLDSSGNPADLLSNAITGVMVSSMERSVAESAMTADNRAEDTKEMPDNMEAAGDGILQERVRA